MKYPHYTFDGCFWRKYRSSKSVLTVHDSLDSQVGIENQEYGHHPTIDLRPSKHEHPVSGGEFTQAFKRCQKRLTLLLHDKNDSHLER
jgi:hypothetical protein